MTTLILPESSPQSTSDKVISLAAYRPDRERGRTGALAAREHPDNRLERLEASRDFCWNELYKAGYSDKMPADVAVRLGLAPASNGGP